MMNLAEAKQSLAPGAQNKRKEESVEKFWLDLAKATVTAKPENPLFEEGARPDNTQNAQPPMKGTQIPMYLPANADATIHGDKQPVHVMEMQTRNQYMSKGTKAMGDIYRNYLYAWLCLFATIALFFVGFYIPAAATAYGAGHFWSEKEVGVAWDIQWLKGKSAIVAA